MNGTNEEPCAKRINAACFRANPLWAKQAFAYRILHILTQGQITRRLPRAPERLTLPPPITLLTTIPPLYSSPWEPGPPKPQGGIIPGAGETLVTATGSTADGRIYSQEATWDAARNNPTTLVTLTTDIVSNMAMQARFQIGSYWVGRSFLYFDLSAIPSGRPIVSATVGVVGYLNALTQVSIQEGTQADTLTNADFNAFSGTAFSILTWQKYAAPNFNTNLFELDSAGKTYVRSKFGSTAKFCLREYTKDYLDVEPTGPGAANGMYYANYFDADYRPYISIIHK